MIDAVYPLDHVLPTQRALAEEFGVSRDTVQRVLRELAAEGWIVSKQGSGSRVIKTQRVQTNSVRQPDDPEMTLGRIITRAFEGDEVALDVATLTSESLRTHLQLQSQRIRAGAKAPQRIRVRLLMPADDLGLPYPRAKENADDPRPRERLRDIAHRSVQSLRRSLDELRVERLVPDVELDVRHTMLAPTFKVYLLNGTEALFGLYQGIDRRILLDSGEAVEVADVLGLDAALIHFQKAGDPYSADTFFVERMQSWFDSVWERFTHEGVERK